MTDPIRPPEGPCFPDLKGKVALVTGGGHGIGRGICLRLATEGMRVLFCGRKEKELDETLALLRAQGAQASRFRCDLSKREEIDRMFEEIRAETDTLDLLVHNAAMLAARSFQETDFDLWRLSFATNVDSMFLLAKKCSEFMLPRRSGNMVMISTIGAQRPHFGLCSYDSGKGAMETFTRAIAIELAESGIRVNAVAPGPIATKEVAFQKEIPLSKFSHPYVPDGRRGTPADIAAAVAFLASTQSEYIVGQILTVDGGSTVQLNPRGIWI